MGVVLDQEKLYSLEAKKHKNTDHMVALSAPTSN